MSSAWSTTCQVIYNMPTQPWNDCPRNVSGIVVNVTNYLLALYIIHVGQYLLNISLCSNLPFIHKHWASVLYTFIEGVQSCMANVHKELLSMLLLPVFNALYYFMST